VTLHPRTDWTKARAANAHPFEPSQVRGLCVHWNGPPVPKSAFTDPRHYLEAVRRFHVNTRGWSDIAYNFAVDQRGDVWVLRGMRHRSAANGGRLVNARWVAVLAIVGRGQRPSSRMLDGIRRVAAKTRRAYPRRSAVTTHRAIRPEPTACPGPDLTRWVRAADFTEGDEMTRNEMIQALVEELRDQDSPLSVALRGNVRIAVERELQDERQGENPGQIAEV
jgi:hypothetical protein